jgi:hypothetical protein
VENIGTNVKCEYDDDDCIQSSLYIKALHVAAQVAHPHHRKNLSRSISHPVAQILAPTSGSRTLGEKLRHSNLCWIPGPEIGPLRAPSQVTANLKYWAKVSLAKRESSHLAQ